MELKVFHLVTRSPLHIGERGIGIESTDVLAHADTVFSALCSIYRQVSGVQALDEMLDAFVSQSPPFRLTSAFPFVSVAGQIIRLYPRPLYDLPGLSADDLDGHKRIKKVLFVSEEVLLSWVTGTAPNPALVQDGEVAVTPTESELLHQHLPLNQAGQPVLWEVAEVPRVTVDRVNNASQVFQAGRVTYAPGGGLWVGFRWLEAGWLERIQTLLMLLGDAGLGGERSVGHGQFDVGSMSVIDLPDATDLSMTLSPVWPASAQEVASLLGPETVYQLVVRRGWIGSPEGSGLRRKSTRMIAEGSILWNASDAGGVANVTPAVFYQARQDSHPVYRYGLALSVGVTRS